MNAVLQEKGLIPDEEDTIPTSVLPDVADMLTRLRKEAVEGRASSGIEERWTYADDAYNGEDEVTKNKKKT